MGIELYLFWKHTVLLLTCDVFGLENIYACKFFGICRERNPKNFKTKKADKKDWWLFYRHSYPSQWQTFFLCIFRVNAICLHGCSGFGRFFEFGEPSDQKV